MNELRTLRDLVEDANDLDGNELPWDESCFIDYAVIRASELAIESLDKLLRDVRPYIEVESKLPNSGQGNVIGNPAVGLLERIDQAL